MFVLREGRGKIGSMVEEKYKIIITADLVQTFVVGDNTFHNEI